MNSKVHVKYIIEELQNVMTEIDEKYKVEIIRGDIIKVTDNTTNNKRVNT